MLRELGAQDGEEVLGTLARAARVEDQFIRRTAIEVIGRHPRGCELREIILNALGDKSEYVVRTAGDVVAKWKFSDAHDLVAALLGSASKATREVAIRTLGAVWVDADFPLVFDIYLSASEIELRREAAWVLREHATEANWRVLFDAFYRDRLARHRQWAAELAERFVGSEVLPVLSCLSKDVDGHVRKAASRAIGNIERIE
jgi:HEAT repeat protein